MRKESVRKAVKQNATVAISAAHLLHPTRYFNHPRDVLAAHDGKRADLVSWASGTFAVVGVSYPFKSARPD